MPITYREGQPPLEHDGPTPPAADVDAQVDGTVDAPAAAPVSTRGVKRPPMKAKAARKPTGKARR